MSSKKFNFGLIKSHGGHQDIYWQMWGEPLISFWSAVVCVSQLSHGGLQFFRSLSEGALLEVFWLDVRSWEGSFLLFLLFSPSVVDWSTRAYENDFVTISIFQWLCFAFVLVFIFKTNRFQWCVHWMGLAGITPGYWTQFSSKFTKLVNLDWGGSYFSTQGQVALYLNNYSEY